MRSGVELSVFLVGDSSFALSFFFFFFFFKIFFAVNGVFTGLCLGTKYLRSVYSDLVGPT